MITDDITKDHDFVESITKKLIEPTYYTDIETSISDRKKWKIVGDITQVMSKVLSGASTILAFAAGFFQLSVLSFVSGCLGTTALVLSHFSSFSLNESKKITAKINKILEKLGISDIIDIVTDPSSSDSRLNVKNNVDKPPIIQ